MSNNPISYPILNQAGPIFISDIRLVDNNTVHINGTEIISGEKTFNDNIKTYSIQNTNSITTNNLHSTSLENTGTGIISTLESTIGTITTLNSTTLNLYTLNSTNINNGGTTITNVLQTGSILASNGKNYLRLLNISNYNTTSNTYITQTINNISTLYTEIILTSLIQTSITNTFLSIVNNKFVFNELGDYYINIYIIYSIDSNILDNFNINYSLDNSKSLVEQNIYILNLKYQNIITQIYNINSINTQRLLLYVSASDIVSLTIYKINIDIIKLN